MSLAAQGLDPDQIGVLAQAGHWLAEGGFYLACGTALSIYLGHRRSADLDWFTAAVVPNPLVIWPPYGVALASLDDLACIDLSAIAEG